MAGVLVLDYSSYGHLERMAEAVADGARAVAGTEVRVRRVPELVPDHAENELAIARFQGEHVAKIAAKLAA